MPKLSAVVTARTEVDLRPALIIDIRKELQNLYTLQREGKRNRKDITQSKSNLELLFADAKEYAALEAGVRVQTAMGEVPMKIVHGMTAKKLNATKVTKLLVKLGATMKQVEACYDPPKEKKPYLGVWIPGDDDEAGDDE